jgi:outer membrane protein W
MAAVVVAAVVVAVVVAEAAMAAVAAAVVVRAAAAVVAIEAETDGKSWQTKRQFAKFNRSPTQHGLVASVSFFINRL